ncbi:Gas vesicle protein GvpN [Lentibacillus sp. JNUCC-1]|uniref:gas vesicle protein GvpN n=1 Tax=Lentibacillus sp. JNUCC-1 TaxID=2654513 RepID=UPI0012E70FAF|nr:gas vesicle protein GvpN [Lentibacillus sp. JNUCC-1]MUV37890.1 Gas vesicle protein GvpN [Lentibacillus sp. JNUCC-1]
MSFLQDTAHTQPNQLIQDEETKQLLSRSLSYLKTGYPVHFTGPAGTGKTTLALALARKKRRPVMLIHGNHELNNRDLIGDFTGYTSKKVVDQYVRTVYKKDETVTESWQNGRLLEAAMNGYTLVYDEFTRSRPTTNNIFLSILEENIIPLYGTKSTKPFERVHPSFSIIFTSNPAEYAGVYQAQDALWDRLITIPIPDLKAEQEAKLIAEKCEVDPEEANEITRIVRKLRTSCEKSQQPGPSLRASLMIGQLAQEEDILIDGKDEDFQQLCLDILNYTLSLCMDSDAPLQEAEELIVKTCKNPEAS